MFIPGKLVSSYAFGYLWFLLFRKKKLTSHWKKYIHPLMWRCKWAELKIREFKSQAAKYSKLLAAYDQRKQLESDQFTSEGFDSKSLPFSNQNHRMKAMKRRKRKRIEETTDVPSYMLNHNLFGYFGISFFFIHSIVLVFSP